MHSLLCFLVLSIYLNINIKAVSSVQIVLKNHFNLCSRPQTQNPCQASLQSQASPLACHLSRYPSFSDQHLTKDIFYNHHSAPVHHSSGSTSCSLTPYASAARPIPAYASGSDPDPGQGLDPQAAAQILDSAEGFGFVGAGLNLSGGGCQGQTYSVTGPSGKNTQTLKISA